LLYFPKGLTGGGGEDLRKKAFGRRTPPARGMGTGEGRKKRPTTRPEKKKNRVPLSKSAAGGEGEKKGTIILYRRRA